MSIVFHLATSSSGAPSWIRSATRQSTASCISMGETRISFPNGTSVLRQLITMSKVNGHGPGVTNDVFLRSWTRFFWNWHMWGLVVVVIKSHQVATCSDTLAFGDIACLVCKLFNNVGVKCINVAPLCHSKRRSSEKCIAQFVLDHSNPTSPGLIVFCVHGDNFVGSFKDLGFRLLFLRWHDAGNECWCLERSTEKLRGMLDACWTYVISLMNKTTCENERQCNHESNMTNTNRNI